jgi:hypothetical protein
MTSQTMMAPLGGEIYQEVFDRRGERIVLTYNDLWMIIVCRTSLDGDWVRARQAADMVLDASNKKALVERLWELDQLLGGLPEIPPSVQTLHLQRAHQWFKSRPILNDRQW